MHRLLILGCVLLPLAVGLPVSSAHGAPGVREIDDRILVDGTDPNETDYGARPEQAPLFYEGGHDLLVLDVREARNVTTGEPLLFFRIVNQGGDPGEGELLDIVHFTVNGEDFILLFRTSDNVVYTGEGFDIFQTIEVGDDHVTGAEGGVYFSTLGVGVGDTLEDIWVEGRVGDAAADHMPGGYFYQGVQFGPTSASGRASFTIGGPPPLFSVSPQPARVEGVTFTLSARVENPLTLLSQIVAAETDQGVRTQLVLGPGDKRDLRLTWNVADALNGVNATLRSDLWDYQVIGHLPTAQELLAGTSLDPDTPGQDENSSALERGGRYAATFNHSGDFALVLAAASNQTVVVNVTDTPNPGAVRLLVVSGAPLPERLELGLGETLLVVNAATTPLRVVAHSEEPAPATPGVGLILAVLAVIWAAKRHRS